MEIPSSSASEAITSWTPIKITSLVTVLVAVGILLWLTIDIVLLIFMGILVAIVLVSVSELLQKHTQLSYGWSLAVLLCSLLIVTVAAIGIAGSRIASETDNLASTLQDTWTQLRERADQYEWSKQLLSQSEGGYLTKIPEGWLGQITGAFGVTLGAMSSGLLVLFVAIFVAADPKLYRRGLILLVPPRYRGRGEEVLDELGVKLRWWFIGQLFSMVVVGTSTAIGLWMLGIPYFITLGFIAAVLTFIPNFGPIISAVPAVLLGLTDGPMTVLYVVLLYTGIQAVESNFLTPLIQQRNVHLPPVLGVGAQVLMGILAGLPGLITAAPLAVLGKVLIRRLYIEDTLGDELKEPTTN